MASGSYAKKSSPQQPVDVRSRIPARATRKLPEEPLVEEVDETGILPFGTTVSKAIQNIYPHNPVALPFQREKIVDNLPPHPLKRHEPWMNPLLISSIAVVVILLIVISAGIFQRSPGAILNYSGGKVYDAQVGGNLASSWQNNQPMKPQVTVTSQSGPYAVLGKPTISVDTINQVLAAYNSPAAGKGQALYDMGVQYGIDPVFALAFFMHESTFGNAGEARSSLSLGNLRCIPNAECRDNYAWFPSWEAGFQAWYQLIRNLYVAQWGLTTIEQIIPKYAPAADHNDEAAYIGALKHAIDTWHSGGIIVS